MHWDQFRTLIWLRSRLTVNMLRRMTATHSALTAIVIALLIISTCVAFVSALTLGTLLLPQANSDAILILWNVAAAAFAFFMVTGLVADLQRSDVQSLQQFLHLPVSPWGAFLISYVGAWLTISTFFFLPTLTAIALASIWTRGWVMAVVPLLLAGFFLLLTAVLHQIRGWLATLMINPRRRRQIIALVVVLFVLLAQGPSLINLWFFERNSGPDELRQRRDAALAEVEQSSLSSQERRERVEEIKAAYQRDRQERTRNNIGQARSLVLLVDAAFPLGWLPYGAWSLERGYYLRAAACLLGLFLLTAISLRRSYRTTLRFYQGDFQHGDAAAGPGRPGGRRGLSLVERTLPGLPPEASIVALTSLQALLRSTEVRLMLLSPVILIVVVVALVLRAERPVTPDLHPLMAVSGVFLAVLGVFQMSQNQFGFDRQAFGVWLLAPVRRVDLLLGKNVVIWLIGGSFGLAGLAASACLWPLAPWDLLALILQTASAMLVVSLMGNLTSTLAPIQVKSGGFQYKSPNVLAVLLQIVLTFLMPVVLAPIAAPAASRMVLKFLGYDSPLPWNLILSAVVLLGCIGLYRLLLPWQAELLARREHRILQSVAATVER